MLPDSLPVDRWTLAGVALGLAVVAATTGATGMLSTGEKYTFVAHSALHARFELAAVERGAVSLPDPVDVHYTARGQEGNVVDRLANGSATAGFVPVSALPRLLAQDPDARILPYRESFPARTATLYVPGNSSIETPGDLAGKTVSLPYPACFGVVGFNTVTAFVLAEEYGLNRSEIDYDPATSFRGWLSEFNRSADAQLYLGDPPAGYRPILHPLAHMRTQYVFAVTDPGAVPVIDRTVHAINRSTAVALADRDDYLDSVMARVFDDTVGSPTRSGVKQVMRRVYERYPDGAGMIYRLDSDDRTDLQRYVSHIAEIQGIEARIDVSDRLVASP